MEAVVEKVVASTGKAQPFKMDMGGGSGEQQNDGGGEGEGGAAQKTAEELETERLAGA